MKTIGTRLVTALAATTLVLGGCSAFEGPSVDQPTSAATLLQQLTPEPGATAAPGATSEPGATPEPRGTATPKPAPTPRLTVNDTISYTSLTYVGRIIKLTIKARNPGKVPAGKVSMQIEGVGYSVKSRTPIVGCIPDCKTATGSEGIIYVQWPAPAPGKSRSYTAQLKAKRAGTYRIEVRAYHGPAGDPIEQLHSWTPKVRVK
jgi:hypothetical protein